MEKRKKRTEVFSMGEVENVAVCLCGEQICMKNFSFLHIHKKWLRGCCSQRAAHQV